MYECLHLFFADQLQSIKQIKLSRVICENTSIKTIQSNVFMLPNYSEYVLVLSMCDSPALSTVLLQHLTFHTNIGLA